MNELERLGRPGAYRLGALRARGAGPVPPEPSRPTFARPGHRVPAWAWALAFLAGAAGIAAGVVAGVFYVPLSTGLLAGLAAGWRGWRLRATPSAGDGRVPAGDGRRPAGDVGLVDCGGDAAEAGCSGAG